MLKKKNDKLNFFSKKQTIYMTKRVPLNVLVRILNCRVRFHSGLIKLCKGFWLDSGRSSVDQKTFFNKYFFLPLHFGF